MYKKTGDLQGDHQASDPRFANAAERECARLLDHFGIAWQYEPRTFVLAETPDGAPLEAFAPDFHLPGLDLYLELTTASPALTSRKRRKVRLLRARHPEVQVRLFDRRDLAALARSHGLRLAA